MENLITFLYCGNRPSGNNTNFDRFNLGHFAMLFCLEITLVYLVKTRSLFLNGSCLDNSLDYKKYLHHRR